MPSEIYLTRFTQDLQDELPITEEDWDKCAQELEEVKIEKAEHCVKIYSQQTQEWTPIFWLKEDGSGYMRDSGFFGNDDNYEKAIEIATYLKAFIYHEEGMILFLPHYGLIYDDMDRESPNISLWDVQRLKPEFGEDYAKIIQTIQQEQSVSHTKQKNLPNKLTKNDKANQKDKIIMIIIIGINLLGALIKYISTKI